jgi:glucan phosphorylase
MIMKTANAPQKKSSQHGCLLPVSANDQRTGLTVADLKQSFLNTLFCTLGRVPSAATPHDLYTALALAIRDRVLKQRVQTRETYDDRVTVDHKNQQEETCKSE